MCRDKDCALMLLTKYLDQLEIRKHSKWSDISILKIQFWIFFRMNENSLDKIMIKCIEMEQRTFRLFVKIVTFEWCLSIIKVNKSSTLSNTNLHTGRAKNVSTLQWFNLSKSDLKSLSNVNEIKLSDEFRRD